jgi:hypothetical protein
MLSVANKPFLLSVIMLNAIVLNVAAPYRALCIGYELFESFNT